jgi:hypothetical protein
MHKRSHEIWTDMAARATIPPVDAAKPEQVARALAEVEAALGGMAAPVRSAAVDRAD